jgi:hypothetical protein
MPSTRMWVSFFAPSNDQGLRAASIDEYWRTKEEAVDIESLPSFPYKLGGTAVLRATSVEASAGLEAPAGTVGFCFPSFPWSNLLRPGVGLKFRVKGSGEGSSFSLLVPDQEPLTKTGCFANEANNLRGWILNNSPDVWGFVDSIHPDDRPKKLFLVLEQVLTRTYHITHKQGSSQECEIEFSAGIKLPSVGDASAFVNCHVEKAQAGFGFEVVRETSDVQYAIFLDVHWLFPARVLSLTSGFVLRMRAGSRYFSASLVGLLCRRRAKMEKKSREQTHKARSKNEAAAAKDGKSEGSTKLKQASVQVLPTG